MFIARRFHQSGILTKLYHFLLLKRKFSEDPVTKQAENITKFARKHLCQCLPFTEVAGWRDNCNAKLLMDLLFFIAPLWNTTDFALSELYHYNEELCLCLTVKGIYYPPLKRFYYIRKLILMAFMSKEFAREHYQ